MVYAELVEAAEQDTVRSLAIQSLIATAPRPAHLGRHSVAFPGQS